MDTVITVDKLSKRYRMGEIGATTLKESFERIWNRVFHRFDDNLSGERGNGEYIWALKDVSFEVKRGEVVGIIGRNGAGKSTLLKILSRITEPTSGRAIVRGRVGSLLEVGTGFHPDLTGRENIYLSGALLGMKKKEIDAKFDEIVAFAELEKFIDTPVKRYSSGMYVRLGFAVAAHLEPEILLVDEVLAVGDAAFQKKCLAKMGEVAKEGRTVLFVSHHMNVIQRLCNSCMLLSEGHLEQQGPSHSVIGTYLRRLTRGTQGAPSKPFLDGNSPIHLLKMFFSDIDGNPRTSFTKDQPFFLNIEYQIVEPIKDVHVSVWFLTMDSVVFMSSYDTDCFPIFATCREPGIYRCRVHIRPGFLNVGQYGIRLLAFVPNTPIKFFDDTSLFVEITDPAEEWSHRVGAIVPMFNWEVEYVHNPTTAQ